MLIERNILKELSSLEEDKYPPCKEKVKMSNETKETTLHWRETLGKCSHFVQAAAFYLCFCLLL